MAELQHWRMVPTKVLKRNSDSTVVRQVTSARYDDKVLRRQSHSSYRRLLSQLLANTVIQVYLVSRFEAN
jgi:hypothetical protein